jgi:hypothetical protein
MISPCVGLKFEAGANIIKIEEVEKYKIKGVL